MIAGSFISVLYYQHLWYLMGFAVGLDLAFAKAQAQAPQTVPSANRRRPRGLPKTQTVA
jgi:hypothetical protein